MSDMRDRRDMRDDPVNDEARTPVEPRRDVPMDQRKDVPMDKQRRDLPMDKRKDVPMDRPADDPMARRPDTRMDRKTPTQTEMWPEMADFRHRFEKLESEFIDDPKAAVQNAERLVEEAVEKLTTSMRERIKTMHNDLDGKDGDTESLRLTMVRFRDWIESMGGRRAA